MKKLVSIVALTAVLLMLFTGSAWAKPENAGKANSGKQSTPSKQDAGRSQDSKEIKSKNKPSGVENKDIPKNNKVKNEIESNNNSKNSKKTDSAANKGTEQTSQDDLQYEIKDRKIEIKGKGAAGKTEKNDKTKSAASAVKEFKQKLKVYNKITSQGQELGNEFTDTKEHWADKTVKKLSAIGVFDGYEDGTFKPNNAITGAEVVTLAMKLTEDSEQEEQLIGEEELADVQEWAKEDVKEAVSKGIINLNRFHSKVQMNRAQTAVIIAKAMNLEPVDAEEVPFKDGLLISQEDVGYIMALYAQGIINGSPDGKFNPNSAITRAEMAAILANIIDEQDEQEEEEDIAEEDTEQENEVDETSDPENISEEDSAEEDQESESELEEESADDDQIEAEDNNSVDESNIEMTD